MERKIENVQFLNEGKEREIIVSLSNGAEVHIAACQESWEQWGGTIDDLYVTMPIAERNNAWLHGKGRRVAVW